MSKLHFEKRTFRVLRQMNIVLLTIRQMSLDATLVTIILSPQPDWMLHRKANKTFVLGYSVTLCLAYQIDRTNPFCL